MRYFKHIVTLTLLSIVLISCSSREDANTTIIEASFTIATDATLIYNIGDFNSEGNRTITKQPENFKVSEIRHGDANLEQTAQIYVYVPKTGFTGQEVVEITSRFSSGDSNFKTAVNRLTITVE